MPRTIFPSEAEERQPGVFQNRSPEHNWTLRVRMGTGEFHTHIGADWEATSAFGTVKSRVMVDPQGSPLFDRPVYAEAAGAEIVVWGYDEHRNVRIALLSIERQVPLDSENPESNAAVYFAEIPMGFRDDAESGEEAAAREAKEETGATVVLQVTQPVCPFLNQDPTIFETSPQVFFVEVDLNQVSASRQDPGERILQVNWLTIPELWAAILQGKLEDGSFLRAGNTLGALLMFLAHHQE